jgi:hypothetical protein
MVDFFRQQGLLDSEVPYEADRKNVEHFVKNHVRKWKDQPRRQAFIVLENERYKLNLGGWHELLQIATVKLDGRKVSLRKIWGKD